MALLKIKDFDPNYREVFGGYDVKGLDVYSDVNNEKIGHVDDLLVDEQGYFRYFIIDLGFWAFGKKILLPIERSHVDGEGKHLYTLGLTKEQMEGLPEFNESLKIDENRRERVEETLHRSPATPTGAVPVPPVMPRPMEQAPPVGQIPASPPPHGYPAAAMPGQPIAQPQPPYPPTGHPVSAPAGYAANDPGVQQYGYQPTPVTQEANGQGQGNQNQSVLQRFEQRLRSQRSQSDPRL